MYDLISIGNISIDIYFQGKSLSYSHNRFQLAVGGKYFVDKVKEAIGGGGANVAIGASCQGIKTAVIGKIGDNTFKEIILNKLRKFNVSSRLCQIKNDYWNISSILLSPTGERTIIHYTTPHLQIFENHRQWIKLRQAKNVYFGNLNDVSLKEKIELLRYLKKNEIQTFMNLGVIDCRRNLESLIPLLRHVDVLIINGHEFADLVKAPYHDIHFQEDVVNWYLPQLRDKLVIITEGRKGSYGFWQNKVFHQPAIMVEKIMDTTGAGDGYAAAFIAAFIKKNNLKEAMLKGSKYAARIISQLGAN